jgi:hypothetical protein
MRSLFLLICTVPFVLMACEKKTVAVLSSEKTISSVVFKASDHPGLPSDIAGVLQADSIKVKLPHHISLNSLIPTFSFAGKSITPSNRTAQNFTNPVTYTLTAEDGTTRNYVFSVTRELADSATLLSGRWRVIRDSVSNVGGFYFNDAQGMMFPLSANYYGMAQDYWDFSSNGTVSIHENNMSFTDAYQLVPNNKLDIEVWTGPYGAATIEKLTSEEAVFIWTKTSPNGGQYYRRAYLRK